MTTEQIQDSIEEATFAFTMGEHDTALQLLDQVLTADPENFDAWHAKTEIHFDRRELDDALSAAEICHRLSPDDVHINTSLSRIWMERGDKEMAEKFGAKARILGWKEQLKEK